MKIEKFLEDRFGMFIHWGAYSVSGRSEWVRSHERLTIEAYQVYIDQFNPNKACLPEWAKLAKKAGMKYAVMTTKHHDGFCLFNSAYTDYSTYHTIGRDLVREFVDAFRAEGIQIGFYYSMIDWYHPDYPTYGDLQHPRRDCLKEKERESQRNLATYIAYFHNQVDELLSNYGKIDIMWFDFSYNNSPESQLPMMKGETWEATKLVRMIRERQPDCIFNNRLGSNGGMLGAEPACYAGDFTSPEQIIPPQGLLNVHGEVVPWEACLTMTNSWCYTQNFYSYKQTRTLIRALIACVSKNGNLLLNVGPTAKGEIPAACVDTLRQMGDWLAANGESIYGCKAADFDKPEWGRYTQKGNKLYAHLLDRGVGPIPLIGLEGKIELAKLLSDGVLMNLERPWNVTKFPNDAFLTLPWFDQLPDEAATVIELTLKDKAKT